MFTHWRRHLSGLYGVFCLVAVGHLLWAPRKGEVRVELAHGNNPVQAEIRYGASTSIVKLELPARLEIPSSDFTVRVFPRDGQLVRVKASVRSATRARANAEATSDVELGIRADGARIHACSGFGCLSDAATTVSMGTSR